MARARFTRSLAACCSAACLLGAAHIAVAQGAPSTAPPKTPARISLFGTGGYNGQTDDESRLGEGIGLSGGVGYRVTTRLWVEASVARFEHRRDLLFHVVTFDAEGRPVPVPYPARLTGSATYLLGQVRYVFSLSRLQPYVIGAVGFMRYSGNGWAAVFPPEPGEPPRTVPGVTATSGAFGGGGGVDFVASRRLAMGPYVGLLLSNTGQTGTKYLLHGGFRLTLGM